MVVRTHITIGERDYNVAISYEGWYVHQPMQFTGDHWEPEYSEGETIITSMILDPAGEPDELDLDLQWIDISPEEIDLIPQLFEAVYCDRIYRLMEQEVEYE